MSTTVEVFQREAVPVNAPIWLESLMGFDYLALRCSPVYYGVGVPCGDGSGVVLVPGFLANDLYLWELNLWLYRVGYRPHMSQIGWNANCFDLLSDKLINTVEIAYAKTGRKIHLIGHSLGGMLARSVAEQRPERVASVITLGSPFRGISSHPIVLRASNAVREQVKARGKPANCLTGNCDCKSAEALGQSLTKSRVMQTAIYSKSDGIVDWRMCLNDDPATNFEVTSTHAGMAFNPYVYYLLGLRLSQASKLSESSAQAGKI
jgi:pimeloyl-ACP methyl ester carboxylesterase